MANHNYTVLKDARDSLKKLLGYILDPTLTMPAGDYNEPNRDPGSATNVTLSNIKDDSPGNLDYGSENQISVFLYQVLPNTFLRNNSQSNYNSTTNNFKLQNKNIALDLYYMITAYSASRENEEGILERIIQVMNGDAVIKGNLLQGSLKENGNDNIKIQPITHSLDEVNKIWSIFPNKVYRISLFYMLSPVFMSSAKIPPDTVPVTKVGVPSLS